MAGLLTTSELAAHLRVTSKTVQRWARTGHIPAFQLSKKAFRYNLEAVLARLVKSPLMSQNALPRT
jgi:excisionase family DNA binding protein